MSPAQLTPEKPWAFNSSSKRRLSDGSGMKMLEHCSPARLKVLLGAVQTMACSAISGTAAMNGVWGWPG